MQLHKLAIVFLAALAGPATAAENPIAKVITLLQKLMDQVKTEGQTEEVAYAKFVYWCKTSTSELQGAITDEKDAIDTLQSTIDGKTKDIELFKEDIKKLEDEILALESAGTEATTNSGDRNTLYLSKKKDLEDTIKSIGEAVTALEAAAKTTNAALLKKQHRLAQTHIRDIFALIATVATEGEQNSLMSFVGNSSGNGTARDPLESLGDYSKHVKKYSFKSNSVTELLKGLQLKFEDELVEATKAETNAANAFTLSKSARDAALKAAKDSKTQKDTDLSDAQGALTTAQSSLTDQEADLKADSSALDTMEDSCRMKKSEWEERTSIRSHELKAMDASIKILAKVSGVRTEAPSNPVPPTSPVSLLQIASDPQARVVQLLKASAKTYRSQSLERLAVEVASHVPKQFQDIINQIEKMIFRLKQEQIDEDNHKAWCDMEIEKTSTSKDAKNDKILELTAKIKEGNAQVVTLTSEIEAAQLMVTDIKKFQAEATEIRQTGKEENALAIKDAVEAQRAITNAISVLQTFYKSSGQIPKEPWEFLQEPVQLGAEPSTWDSGYSGVADAKEADKGVIAVLEACSSDFAKMEANTRAQEVADQTSYDEAMKKNSIELARRLKETDMKGEQKKRLVAKIADQTANKKHVSDEYESTEQYEKDLQKACVDGDSTYVDRKAARDGEIKSLQEAQVILDKAFDAPAPAPPPSAFLMRIHQHS